MSSILLLVALAPWVASAAPPVAARWIGGSGDWSDPLHWDVGVAPNNDGVTTYSVTIEAPAADLIVTVNQNVSLSALTNLEQVVMGQGSTLTLLGPVQNGGLLQAAPSTLRLSGATVANAGFVLRADGGLVEVVNTPINGGTLAATDNVASRVQFAGDVTLNGVAWDDPGAGVFRVDSTTTRLPDRERLRKREPAGAQ